MKKKGQGLSLNTVIIAAIVLIVLVVLWAIFTGRMGAFSRGLQTQDEGLECGSAAIGGVATDGTTCTGSTKIPGSFSDVGENQVCCAAA